MKIGNLVIKYLLLIVILLIAAFSCNKKSEITDTGVLKGKITIGPLCPVGRIPPDPACLPTAETYRAWATAIFTVKEKLKYAILIPNLDGTFEIELPVGDYFIDYSVVRFIWIGKSNLPATFSITKNDTITFNVNIDTGIR